MDENTGFPKSIEEWRRLEPSDREFFVWQTLRDSMEARYRYAGKWVEKAMVSVVTTMSMAVLYAILNFVLRYSPTK